ncbi:MAG TPA: substrate-binding domain-containing protein, partial [Anaerolineales bacterium]|nr:substrate-binding domain-containing protein [Anaerolineales bacterium]
PKKEIGAQAVSLLVDRLSQKSRPPRRLVLPPELIIRRSTQGLDQFMGSPAPGLNPAVPDAVDQPS